MLQVDRQTVGKVTIVSVCQEVMGEYIKVGDEHYCRFRVDGGQRDVGVISVGKKEWGLKWVFDEVQVYLIFEGRGIVGGFLEASMRCVSLNIHGGNDRVVRPPLSSAVSVPWFGSKENGSCCFFVDLRVVYVLWIVLFSQGV